MKIALTSISLVLLFTLGCKRDHPVIQLVGINLQISVNNWAGGTGEIDRVKYEKEIKHYNNNPWFVQIFLTEPNKPPEIISVNPDDLKILIRSEGQLIFDSPVKKHYSSSEAYVASDLKNVISITNGDKTLEMYEFTGRINQTIHINLGPGVTFTKW